MKQHVCVCGVNCWGKGGWGERGEGEKDVVKIHPPPLTLLPDHDKKEKATTSDVKETSTYGDSTQKSTEYKWVFFSVVVTRSHRVFLSGSRSHTLVGWEVVTLGLVRSAHFLLVNDGYVSTSTVVTGGKSSLQ